MTVGTHDPCVCVQSKSGAVSTPRIGNTETARRRRVYEQTHTGLVQTTVGLLLLLGAKLHTQTPHILHECVQSVGTLGGGRDV